MACGGDGEDRVDKMFLHARLLDPSKIQALVASAAVESESLEFKREFWKNEKDASGRVTSFAKEEAGKDVAALANAIGGDILVGIAENKGRAAQFADLPLSGNPRGDLDMLLRASLVPLSVVNTIEVEPVDCKDADGHTRQVLVISVPPWPHGPVGVLRAEGIRAFSFPFRIGSDTRFMEMDQMIAHAEAGRRATFLKLLDLKGPNTPDVRFVGEVSWEVLGEHGVLPGLGTHGTLLQVTESTVEVHMGPEVEAEILKQLEMALARTLARARHSSPKQSGDLVNIDHPMILDRVLPEARATAKAALTNMGTVLTVPLSLLSDAWRANGRPGVRLLVRDGVRFVNDGWLPTGRS